MQFIQDMIAPWLIGQDPMMIEKLAARMKGDGRLAPPDHGWWKRPCGILMGKICGQPTYKVMGAYRDKFPPTPPCELRSDEERREDALRLLEEGFRAVKLPPVHADDQRRPTHCRKHPQGRG